MSDLALEEPDPPLTSTTSEAPPTTTTEAPVTTTTEASVTGEILLFAGSGASTLDLGGPLSNGEYGSIRYFSEDGLSVVLLDESGSQAGYYGHSFVRSGGAQGVNLLTNDALDTYSHVTAGMQRDAAEAIAAIINGPV